MVLPKLPFEVIRSHIFSYLPIYSESKIELHDDIKKYPLEKKWIGLYKKIFQYGNGNGNVINDYCYFYWLEYDIERFLNNNIPAFFDLTHSYKSFLKRLCLKLGKKKHYSFSFDSKYTTMAYMKTLTYEEFLLLDTYLTNINRKS